MTPTQVLRYFVIVQAVDARRKRSKELSDCAAEISLLLKEEKSDHISKGDRFAPGSFLTFLGRSEL